MSRGRSMIIGSSISWLLEAAIPLAVVFRGSDDGDGGRRDPSLKPMTRQTSVEVRDDFDGSPSRDDIARNRAHAALTGDESD